MSDYADRLKNVRQELSQAAAQHHQPMPLLLAVSKQHPAAAIAELHHAGQRTFGESYVQEALAKQLELADLALEWHFIGPVQSNKTRDIANHFAWVHSVDRVKIAQRLNDQRDSDGAPLNICVQVNLDGESSKSGVSPDELLPLCRAIMSMPKLRLRGLMCIPRWQDDFAAQRSSFARLRQLQEQLGNAGMADLDTLSMGMSGDFSAAIAEGSTIVRIGTALFGEREY